MNRVYSDVKAEKYIVMPNHVHMIITVSEQTGTSRTPSPTSKTIPLYISAFKRMINREVGRNIWGRSYHDRIIRNEKEFEYIWQYIDSNAAKWNKDCFYKEQEVKP